MPYFRREYFENRLDPGVGHRLGTKLGLPVRWRRCRAGGRVRSGILLHGGYRDLAAARLLRCRLEPDSILLELIAQRALSRRERERHTVAGDLYLLRLRDHHVVENGLALADLAHKGVLKCTSPRA